MKKLISDSNKILNEASVEDYKAALLVNTALAKKMALKKASSFKKTHGDVPHGRVVGMGIATHAQWKKHWKDQGLKYIPINHKIDEHGELVEETNLSSGKDTIELTVPLLIKLLEWAREDSTSDIQLHKVVERIVDKNQLLDSEDFLSLIK